MKIVGLPGLSWELPGVHAYALTLLVLRCGLTGSLGSGALRRRDHKLAKLSSYTTLVRLFSLRYMSQKVDAEYRVLWV